MAYEYIHLFLGDEWNSTNQGSNAGNVTQAIPTSSRSFSWKTNGLNLNHDALENEKQQTANFWVPAVDFRGCTIPFSPSRNLLLVVSQLENCVAISRRENQETILQIWWQQRWPRFRNKKTSVPLVHGGDMIERAGRVDNLQSEL